MKNSKIKGPEEDVRSVVFQTFSVTMVKRKQQGAVAEAAGSRKRKPVSEEPEFDDASEVDETQFESEAEDMSVDEEEDDEEGSEGSEEDSEEDSEEEEGEEEDAEGGAEKKESKPKNDGVSLHKSSLAQDVQIARETSELFKSNIFKLQIDELLSEIKIDQKHISAVEKLLHSVHGVLAEKKEKELYSVSEAIGLFSTDIAIPFVEPRPPKDAKYKLGFASPDYVTIVGSFSLKTTVKQPGGIGIDIVLHMPSDLFQEKDYLNYRYFHKRAFYLACLARQLSAANLPVNVMYHYLNDDPLRPIIRLQLTSSKSLASKFHINIIPAIEPNLFETRKLAPERNCVRLEGPSSDSSTTVPTPFYNSSIISDSTYRVYSEYLHRTRHLSEGFNDACKLGRLWLRQRGFGSSPALGGFGHFEFAMLMACLLQGSSQGNRVLMHGYSSYQLFKATLKFLASHDLSKRQVSFSTDDSTKINDKTLKLSGPAVIYDRNNHFNLLYKMSASSYALLRHEAAVTSDLLMDVVKDRFDSIFMKDITPPHLRFDVHFNVKFSRGTFLPRDQISHISYRHFVSEKLYRVLTKGYGKRTSLVAVLDSNTREPWAVSRRRGASDPSSDTVTVGLLLDSEECEKLVTHGPGAEEEEEADLFRRFWGKKSELRRFQDGRIAESVVWKTSPSQLIVHSIADYLLERHFSDAAPSLDISSYTDLVEFLPAVSNDSITGTLPFQKKNDAFLKLSTVLQDISSDAVPLTVKSVLPTSPSLRYASIHEPVPYRLDGDDTIANGILEFETSGKWPDDLEAIEKTKVAFLLKLGQALEQQDSSYTAFVGVDNVDGLEIGFLQIQTPDGFIFRLRVSTDRDEQLYARDRPASLIKYKRTYGGAVLHNRLVYRLALKFPLYSPTVRLVKKWFASQMLSSAYTEAAIELIVLKVFLDSAPYVPPASAVSGFYRTMEFLGNWDWREEGLVLTQQISDDVENLNQTEALLTSISGTRNDSKQYQELQRGFTIWRGHDPAFTLAPLYIGTFIDTTGVLWTEAVPKSDAAKVVAARLTALTKAVSQLARSGSKPSLFFTASVDDYDFVIHTADPYATQEKSQYRNLEVTHFPSLDRTVDVSAHVVDMYFEDLQEKYRDCAVLFYSPFKDSQRRPKKNVIAGIWHRDAMGSRKFKVNINYSTIPTEGDNVELNKKAIMKEIELLGGDLVTKIGSK